MKYGMHLHIEVNSHTKSSANLINIHGGMDDNLHNKDLHFVMPAV